MRSLVTICFGLAMAPSLAFSQVELKHAPDLKAGEQIRTEAEVHTAQTLTLGGMPIETRSDLFFITREEVLEPQKLRGSFSTFQITLGLPGGIEYQFDVGNPDQPAPIPQLEVVGTLFKAMAQAKWITVLGDDGKVKAMTYEGDPLAEVPEELRGEANLEKWKKAANIEIRRLPGRVVSVGEKWKRTEESDIGQGQTMTFEKEYTYVGEEEVDGRTLHKISGKHLSVVYEMSDGGASPLQITDSKLKVAESEGTFLYDADLHQIVSTDDRVRITGTLEASANGQEFPGELDLTIHSKGTTIRPAE